MSETIHGVILAAGRSTRMGRPKPLLELGPETFLQRAAGTLRRGGCGRILAVVPAGAEWVEQAAAGLELEIVPNPAPESEQIESLRLALDRLPASAAAVVLPVDLPFVSSDTVSLLVGAYRDGGAPLVLPFYNGVAGHPVLLAGSLFGAVVAGTLDEGLRSLVMLHAREMREVKVQDPGILIDIDTPDDYWRYIQQK
jgi:molybdenum cofactor cytidylyltransferase